MALVDTNVLVYAYDPRDERKTRRAVKCLRNLKPMSAEYCQPRS